MDKELEKMLKDVNGVLGDYLDKNKDKMSKMINDRFEEASKKEFKITTERDGSGKVKVKIIGERLAVLQGLAGLEKTLLKKFEVPELIWEMLKDAVDTEDAE